MDIAKRCRRLKDGCLLWVTNHPAASVLARPWRMLWYRCVMGFTIGTHASVLPDVRFSGQGNLDIGPWTIVNNSVRIDNRRPVRIGAHTSVSYGALLLTEGHDTDAPNFASSGGPIDIGDHVWICARAVIGPGVTIGDGAVVYPGAVVTRDVPAYAVVGGVPARHLRERRHGQEHNIEWNPWIPPLG